MWSFITSIPGLVTGLFGSINHITDAIGNEKIAVLKAQTEEDKIAAQERVNSLTLKRDLMIAEAATSKLNIRMRFALAACVLVIIAKIFVWDKAVGPFFGCVGRLSAEAAAACHMFVTDPLDDNLWHVVMVVIGFYFLSEAATFFKKK
jgi:hypothetical protein